MTALFVVLLAPSIFVNGEELRPLRGHIPQAVAESKAIRPLPTETKMNLAIGLPLRNQEELDELLLQLTDPASPSFQHYLTAEQFTARYGPSEQDYQKLIAFAVTHGLQVTGTHPNRMVLDISGAVTDVEAALHVKIMTYQHPLRGEFYAPDREPSLDATLNALDISGLDNFVLPRPMGLTHVTAENSKAMVTGSGPGGYFVGNDFRKAYASGVTLTGSGQKVGLLEFDGFFAGDVQKNFAQAGTTPVSVQSLWSDRRRYATVG
jgi:subtilase family serine protease